MKSNQKAAARAVRCIKRQHGVAWRVAAAVNLRQATSAAACWAAMKTTDNISMARGGARLKEMTSRKDARMRAS